MQISVNGNTKSFEVNSITIAVLVHELNIVGKRVAVECNGEIVPKSKYAEVHLEDGDKREAFLAGRMAKKLYTASPSSPTTGMIT
ncbi:MAG: sulfur carrier protein ThiS [Methylophilaceae bacterium]